MASKKDGPIMKIKSHHIAICLSWLIIPIYLLCMASPSAMSLWNDADAPTDLTSSSPEHPLSFSPIISWSKDTDAVIYEIEFFDHDPGHISRDETSNQAIYRSRRIYMNQYNPDLVSFAHQYLGKKPLYWRVRSLGQDGEPISPFSRNTPLYTSAAIPPMEAPEPLVSAPNTTPLLYPVYSWVRQHDAASFILQIFAEDPDRNPAAVPIDTLTSDVAEIYDQKPRYSDDDFYWRVHAVDAAGQMLGAWSPVVRFRTAPADGWNAAVFGDSISHGGGHISYSPADPEFSWLTYLDFPAINLSMSGDTTDTMLQRFAQDVLPFHPHYLLIFDGSNSLRGGVSAMKVISDFEELKHLCLENNIKPIFLTLPPINPQNIDRAFAEPTAHNWRKQFKLVNDYIRTQVHIDVAASFDMQHDLPTEYALDGLHEDVAGKMLIATTVNKAWKKACQQADIEQ
jgi:lysophospholipase L1-like esterase